LIFTQDDKIVHFIKSINPAIRLILWYGDPVFRVFDPNKLSNTLCEKWSFDKNDALKFGMRFNPQYFFDNMEMSKSDIIYDILFVGRDKGRRHMIDSLEKEMLAADIKTYFYIVDNNLKFRNSRPIVPYEKYLTLLSKSKSILDIVQPGQSGLTFRPMESLFFRKKLITNDASIKTQDFYHPSNVFIVGENKVEDLKQFLATPFEDMPTDIIKYYDINSWLNRFFE
jgi:hypothetical protein